MNLAELQKEACAITKENLKVLRMVHGLQGYLFHVGVNASLDDPVGVAPSYDAAARRATEKGLLIGVGNRYTIGIELWECGPCGFTFEATHENTEGGYTCPECEAQELYSACKAALSHLKELGEAWRRGAINETDGRGGERSNRNADVVQMLSSVIEP